MGHHCCSKQKVKRGLWSPEEDEKLIRHITSHGHGCWSSVPKLAGLQRCGKSCRLRWINYLRPDLKRGSFTEQEERIIIDVHRILGNRWAQIAKHLPGRTDNEVKNFWNSCIKKKLIAQGLDPNTHNLLSSHHHNTSRTHTDTTSSKQTFSITTTTNNSHTNVIVNDASAVDMKTSFVTTMSSLPPLDSNSFVNPPASIYDTSSLECPNPISFARDEHPPIRNMMEFANPSSMEVNRTAATTATVIPSCITSSAFEIPEEDCMWAGTGLESLEPARQQVVQLQQHPQLGKACEEQMIPMVDDCSNAQNLDDSSLLENSNFDFEFMESALLPCGVYRNVNPMDQLVWDS
ncbi:hypothetical protein NMG60_11036575 [Bertholletia excelsa]